MKKKNLIALACFMALPPLSAIFTKSAGRDVAQSKIAYAFTENAIIRSPMISSVTAFANENYSWWLDDQGVPNQNARTLLLYLQNSAYDGLNPKDYKADEIAALVQKSSIPAAEQAAYDRLLSLAMIDYAHDMTGPRISPTVIGSRAEYWRKPMTKGELLQKYAATGNMDQTLADLAPKDPLYGALRTELQRLLQLPAADAAAAKQKTQVIANLERLRWDLPRPERYIEVNIADQTLNAVDSGVVVHHIKMIVGKTTRQTAEFTTPITGVKFNPTWHVPVDLMMRDKIPVMRKNPYAFEAKKIYVYYDGKKSDPGIIRNMSDQQIRQHITMKQMPGEGNALGHLVALMTDPYIQFLHYTNQPELFAKEPRYFSSGCMRMSEPDSIASFILSTDMEQIAAYKKGSDDNNVKASQPLTFFSVYHSITLNADGTLQYHKDAYGRDKKIFDALKKKGELPPLTLPPKTAPKTAASGPNTPVV
ncbi:MAG: L,D-transpeptidase family protein [Alphaproteobacteria bacterium]|nr:L,D-transpeptidase family protein [Alphaproteobacteria bacterium]